MGTSILREESLSGKKSIFLIGSKFAWMLTTQSQIHYT